MVRTTPMTRPMSTHSTAEAVSTRCSSPGETLLGQHVSQTSNCPPDLQVSESPHFICKGNTEVTAQPKGQEWTSTRTREEVETSAAAEGIHEQEAPCIEAQDQEKPSAGEMREYALSRVYAHSSPRREQLSTCQTHDRDSRNLDRPSLTRCRSWPGAPPRGYPPAPGRQSQCRRWSICTSDGGGPQHRAGVTELWAPTVDAATVTRWYEDFHQTRAQEWQKRVAGFGLAWKQWCFAQRRTNFWLDDLIKQAIKQFWQPFDDFNYVLSVYSFLEGLGDCNLLPHLRPVYMAWRSPEQVRLHEGCHLQGGEDGSLEGDNISSRHDTSRDDGLRVATSKYPLTRQQHLRVGRICGDVGGQLKDLQCWLNLSWNCRQALAAANNDADIPNEVVAQYRWHLGHATREFSGLAKTLTAQLRVSRTRLCEALGLDPEQVPGGDTPSAPTMTATRYERAVEPRSPRQDWLALPRGFDLKKASLQASRIALKANLYITLLPCSVAQKILGRMMVRSTEMATLAREAGDDKAEAKMRRLHNKIRKVSKRTDQQVPGLKPKMTLLDSETWPAVLNPRKDMRVEVHGDTSLPVEALIDMLLAPKAPVTVEGGAPSGASKPPSVGPVLTAPEKSPTRRASGDAVL